MNFCKTELNIFVSIRIIHVINLLLLSFKGIFVRAMLTQKIYDSRLDGLADLPGYSVLIHERLKHDLLSRTHNTLLRTHFEARQFDSCVI